MVTDSLFILDKHIKRLEDAGYKVERLDKPAANEEELIKAIRGKSGYILGGVEKVTEKVIEAGDKLKAIVFTGTGWDGFITGHKLATEKGILIGAAPHLNAHAVAEFGMAMTLTATRNVIGLARGNSKKFETTKSLSEIRVGILGLGHIGQDYLKMLKGLGAKKIYYSNRTRSKQYEVNEKISYLSKKELFKKCDLVFISLSIGPGEKYINADDINGMEKGSIIVSISDPLLFDLDALHSRLKNKEIAAAFDENIEEERYQKLPLDTWYTPNESTAFNTGQTIENVSTSCVQTLINLLETGQDKFRVN